jgi:Ca-activated chloride channel family protein
VLAGIAIMIVALARPAATIMTPSQQGTVILTFDVSGSMRADDVKPNRLEAAKTAARAFVEKQSRHVRIGVVSFSDNASLVQSPTSDREAVLAAINRLQPQRRTAIGSGILTSLDAIFEGTEPKPAPGQPPSLELAPPKPEPTPMTPGSYDSAVIIMLSDGVSNTGTPPLEAVKQAADRGVRVYTVGLGSIEGTVLRLQGFGMRVRLDEETLKQVALRSAANYFKAESENDLLHIYENLSTRLVFKPQQTELTAGFTGLAALFILAAAVISMLWFNRLP